VRRQRIREIVSVTRVAQLERALRCAALVDDIEEGQVKASATSQFAAGLAAAGRAAKRCSEKRQNRGPHL
jgi:hypothetical protein